MHTIIGKRPKLARILLGRGADPKMRDDNGRGIIELFDDLNFTPSMRLLFEGVQGP